MKKKVILGMMLILIVCASLLVFAKRANAPSDPRPSNANLSSAPATVNPQTAALNKSRYSTTDPTSLWVIVNKVSPLPSGYAPSDLTTVGNGEQMRSEAAAALAKLFTAAKATGNPMSALSGYRSYTTQVSTYNNYVKTYGQAKADTFSARPGHSEHQTGLAIDVGAADSTGTGTCNLDICFGNLPAGKWLVAHAYEYGFIIRYPAGKETITGYQYEPWHVRYVGVDLATELHASGQTMEEFFGVVPNKQPY